MNEFDSPVRNALEYHGWTLLLPAATEGRVLCLESGSGHAMLALARVFGEVVAVPADVTQAGVLADLARRAGATNVRVARSWPEANVAAGIVGAVAFLTESATGSSGPDTWRDFLSAARAGRPRFALVAGHTGVGRADSVPAGSLAVRGTGELERAIESAGLPARQRWPLRMRAGRPYEIVPAVSRWVAPHSSLKAGLLGGRLGRWLAPAHVVVGQANAQPTALAQVLAQVAQRTGRDVSIARFLTLADKTVLVLGSCRADGTVVVIPHSAVARRRRERERTTLSAMQSDEVLDARLREFLPRPLGTGSVNGQRWFAVERIDGEFIDHDCGELDAYTDEAVDLLAALHVATRHDVLVDEMVLQRLAGRFLTNAGQRYPAHLEPIAELARGLRATLVGQRLPLVCMHGDYKIENIGFDRRSRRATGVIDWELADRSGAPLLDLLYLLTYNRMLRADVPFERAAAALISGDFEPAEQTLLDRYLNSVPLAPQLLAPLRALFLLQAFGSRLHYDVHAPGGRAGLGRLIDASLQALTDTPRVCSGDAA